MSQPLFNSSLSSLALPQRGKLRDIYAVDNEHMLIITTDRLSVFVVVLPTPIPRKGEVLTELSNFWFGRTQHIVPNHLTAIDPESVVKGEQDRVQAP